jgi:hypothetical protein
MFSTKFISLGDDIINFIKMLASAKIIGAGIATISMAGAGVIVLY